jgi:hypothetical protein
LVTGQLEMRNFLGQIDRNTAAVLKRATVIHLITAIALLGQ